MRIGLAGTGRIGALHAATLAGLEQVEQVVVADAFPGTAARVAEENGYEFAPDLDDLLTKVDGLVISTSTNAHAEMLRRGVAAGVPTFCEKPVAGTLAETVGLVGLVEASGVPVHVGFQRRFDAGYQRARAAVQSGELGFIHTIRANTHDQSPPSAAYVLTSGGLFRDCSIHDADVLRFVTGREVTSLFATGANKGDGFFAAGGDIDTGAAVLKLDDDTLVVLTATRYNGGGHDVRMEIMGSLGTIGVGYDDSLAVRSAEAGADYPKGPQKWSFMERFLPAYRKELAAFCDVVAGAIDSPCTVADALAAFRIAEACEVSRTEGRRVDLCEIDGYSEMGGPA